MIPSDPDLIAIAVIFDGRIIWRTVSGKGVPGDIEIARSIQRERDWIIGAVRWAIVASHPGLLHLGGGGQDGDEPDSMEHDHESYESSQALGQFIQFVVHNFPFVLVGFWFSVTDGNLARTSRPGPAEEDAGRVGAVRLAEHREEIVSSGGQPEVIAEEIAGEKVRSGLEIERGVGKAHFTPPIRRVASWRCCRWMAMHKPVVGPKPWIRVIETETAHAATIFFGLV